MHKYLPSKKFCLIVLSILVALGLISLPALIKSTKNNPPAQNLKIQQIAELDTDNDGLKDWEEALNSQIPGTASTSNSLLGQTKGAASSTVPLTVTEKVSQELFLQFLNAQGDGQSLSAAEMEAMADKALSYLPNNTFKTYSKAEIRTVSSLDNVLLRNYANNLAEIIINNLQTKTETVDDIIADTAKIEADSKIIEETQVIFKRFNPLITKNQKTVTDLLKLTVPTVFLTEHLNLLNTFEEIRGKLEMMQKSATDPVILVSVKGQYYQSIQKLADNILKMRQVLSLARVTFSGKSDYGYQLFNVIMSTK